MQPPSFFRLIIKDVIDFFIIFAATALFTVGIYFLLPTFKPVEISFYFFEQAIELFFVNPELVQWFLGLGFGITLIYYLFGAMLWQSTVGGKLMGLTIFDTVSNKPASILQALMMAVGAYVGVVIFFVGPLYAWWLADDTRGFSEKWAQVKFG